MIYDAAEICQTIKKGEDVTAAVAQLEPKIKRFCETRDTSIIFRNEEALFAEDALYDVSTSIKNYWNTIYATFQNPKDKYQALLRFVNAGEKYLGIPHAESICKLKKCGWTAADIMAAYIHSRINVSRLKLSPDVVAEAAKEDWNTALQLLEGKNYDRFFPFFHNSYQIYRQFEWIDFLYYFMEYEDRTFLKKKHKSKRLCKHCEEVLERLDYHTAKAENSSKLAACPDFSVFQNITLKQKHLMRSAAGQKLRKGNEQNAYYVMSFHLVDEACGCGAALCFEPLNKSPDYSDETAKAQGVYFYCFERLYLSDYIPESRRRAPDDMPEEFVKRAYRAFSMAAGLADRFLEI